MYGIIDFTLIDTSPGADTAFAPPQGFSGNYLTFMRERYRLDLGVRQHVAVVGRLVSRREPVTFTGQFADAAKRLVERFNKGKE